MIKTSKKKNPDFWVSLTHEVNLITLGGGLIFARNSVTVCPPARITLIA